VPVPPLRVLFVRHGRVASHRGDVGVTREGLAEARAAGRALLPRVAGCRSVGFLHAPTRRTLQTAEALRAGLSDVLTANGADIALGAPRSSEGIRNPDLWIAGSRVEMVSSAEALAEQLPPGGPGADELRRHPFMAGFWGRDDRISFWIEHPDPPGESADETARRFVAYARSLADVSRDGAQAFVCVTHSGPLRAILRRYVLGEDPGEPAWMEAVDLTVGPDGTLEWRFRDAKAVTGAA
jgi:broad specificity phosphatase PhoE